MSTAQVTADRLCVGLATLFGIGRVPKAPGTAASAAALALVVALAALGPGLYAFAAVFFLLVAVPVCGHAADLMDREDPPEIVLDEVVGILIACVPYVFSAGDGPATSTAITLLLCFLFFRLYDIKKYGWIGRAQNLPGGVGIVMDDVLAGIAAAASVSAVHVIFRMTVSPLIH